MRNLFNKLKIIYYFVIKSISFYPAVISLLFLSLALLMIHYERMDLSEYLHDRFPSIVITSNETARAVVTITINTIVSITVFSFTMVMIVLNQTSSNFSPRLIPGLVRNKSHQVILGYYIGTIIYSLIILINLQSKDFTFKVPGASIFLSGVFTVISLALFVYFIHSISTSIQIGNIMESLYKDTLKELKNELNNREDAGKTNIADIKQWFPVKSRKSGFLQAFDKDKIIKAAKKQDIIIKFITLPGFYIVKDIPFIMVNKKIYDDSETCNEVINSFVFKQEEIVAFNYLYGFKQFSEIAIKALSPAINDPGTASRCINYLTELYILSMKLLDEKVICDEDGNPRLIINQVSFDDLLQMYLSPIRNYSKNDITVTRRLFEALLNIAVINQVNGNTHHDALENFINSIIENADSSISNSFDRETINNLIRTLNSNNIFENKFRYIS